MSVLSSLGLFTRTRRSGIHWIFWVGLWLLIAILLICYGTLTLQKQQKLDDREGPFRCRLLTNQTQIYKDVQCNKGTCTGTYKYQVDAVVIEDEYTRNSFYKPYPSNFPKGVVKLRRECFNIDGSLNDRDNCARTKKNWVVNATHPCYYRPHDKPVFWKNKQMTMAQKTDYILYLTLLLSLFFSGFLAISIIVYLSDHPSDAFLVWFPEPWRWIASLVLIASPSLTLRSEYFRELSIENEQAARADPHVIPMSETVQETAPKTGSETASETASEVARMNGDDEVEMARKQLQLRPANE